MDNKKSLYSIINTIVILVIVSTMSVLSLYEYYYTKNKLEASLEKKANLTIERLRKAIIPFVTSYSINEYEELILVELRDNSVFAIVVEDDITGNLLGETYISGKIRDKNWNAVDFDNKTNKFLTDSYFVREVLLLSNKKEIGKLKIYYSYKFLNDELISVVSHNILITILISFLLILFLFLAMKKYILKPISNLTNIISTQDEEGIPVGSFYSDDSSELFILSNNINKMINKIKTSNTQIISEQKKYQKLLSNSNEMIFIMDTEGNLLEFSKESQIALGYSDKEMKRLSVYDWDKDVTKQEYKNIVKNLSNTPIYTERIHTRKDNSSYIAGIRSSLIIIDDKEYVYDSTRDITSEKKIHDEIQRTNTKFSTIYNNSFDAILLYDIKLNRFEDVNPKACSLYGYTKNEFVKLNINHIEKNNDENKIDKLEHEIKRKGAYTFETKHILKNKTVIDVLISVTAIKLFKKDYLYLSVKDITLHKKQEASYKEFFNSLKVAMYVQDLNGKFIDVNDGFLKMHGFLKEEIIGKSIDLIIASEKNDITQIDKYFEETKKGNPQQFYFWSKEKSGKVFPKEVSLTKARYLGQDAIISVGFDITRQKELENKLNELVDTETHKRLEKERLLIEQSKLAAMGEMIGAIAHQWRQPLNELSISIQNIEYDFEDDMIDLDYIKEYVDENQKIIYFMSKTIDDFRSFFRTDKQKMLFDICEEIVSVTDLLKAQLKNHDIKVEINGDSFKIEGFQTEFKQVIINLINNAKDAFDEKNIKQKNINIELNNKNNSIMFFDNAGGIPDDIINRIFEPYFTTKEQGKGTGIGLYLSKTIIENMGGSLSVENKNDGACFTITL